MPAHRTLPSYARPTVSSQQKQTEPDNQKFPSFARTTSSHSMSSSLAFRLSSTPSSPLKPTPNPSKSFMDLPPELRIMICELAMTKPTLRFAPCSLFDRFERHCTTPIQLNRQVRIEAAPYFFAGALIIVVSSLNVRNFILYVKLLPREHQSMLLKNPRVTFCLSFGFHARRSDCLAPHNYADTRGISQLLAFLVTRAKSAVHWRYEFPGCARCTDVLRANLEDTVRAGVPVDKQTIENLKDALFQRAIQRLRVRIYGRMLQALG